MRTTASASSTRRSSPPTATSRSIPSSDRCAYVLYLKGTAYFAQIKDITRDQQISQNAIDTYTLLIANYPESDYAKDARDKMVVAYDQLAGKEMSVGRYYRGQRPVCGGDQPLPHGGREVPDLDAYRGSAVPADRGQSGARPQRGADRRRGARAQLPEQRWYKEAFDLLQKQGLEPAVNAQSPLATAVTTPAKTTNVVPADKLFGPPKL